MKVSFITNHFLDDNGGGSFATRTYAKHLQRLLKNGEFFFNSPRNYHYFHPKP